MYLLDIGARFGIFSLAAAQLGGKAVAIDPSPMATRMIAKQAGLNGLTDSIRIIQAAISSESGSIEMLNSGVFSDGYFKSSQVRTKSELTQTHATTIDVIADQYGAPTHNKIDVEGQEAAAIRGGRKTLDQCSPIVFLELHNQMVTSERGDPSLALHELVELKYEHFGLDGSRLDRAAILRRPLTRKVATRPFRS
jgi:FkbM family methyltransferase